MYACTYAVNVHVRHVHVTSRVLTPCSCSLHANRLAECLDGNVGRNMFAGVPDMGGIQRGDWLQMSGRILVTLMVFTLVHYESLRFDQLVFDLPAMGTS